MPTFSSKPFRGASTADTIAARYRIALAKHPFALFGLPFIMAIVAGSFILTPATAVRYERQDRKVRNVSEEEAIGVRSKEGKRKVDPKEEYYRLAAKDIDDWEQKRVPRLKGELDGILK